MTARVAILKPDHLGDLVLSVPAIRAIRARHKNTTLFVASRSRGLARFLFPDINDIRDTDLRHLSRNGDEGASLAAVADELSAFDHVICLRDDLIIRDIMSRVTTSCTIASGNHLVHETSIQKQAIEWLTGRYSRTRLFSGLSHPWPARQPRHIALCIAAGFPTNRWTNVQWAELIARLGRSDIQLTLVGGPGERDDLRMLSRLARRVRHEILIGGDDFAGFLQALEPVDLVVATDGGTAHICSLRKPVCSIFGSSPWRRYAPFGQENVLITRDEPCSPCVQFSSRELNGCMTRECMARITPDSVERVIFSDGMDFSATRRVWVERGISHKYEMSAAVPPSGMMLLGRTPPRLGGDDGDGSATDAADTDAAEAIDDAIDITNADAMAEFMTRSDELGGPDAPKTIAWWRGLTFTMPETLGRDGLDAHPLSSGYADLQDRIYGFLTGKRYADLASELTHYDKGTVISGLLAYPGRTPRDLNRYFHAMARLMDEFHLDEPCAILDLGSGWGFTSEYMARLGHRVVGIDINPDFVETGRHRSEQNRLGIDYRVGTFDALPLRDDETFDVIMTFESFHHCRDPLGALRAMVPRLREGGQIMLAGEPFIPPSTWRSWGLRLDALSVWCIAKNGWWESGWTREYMGFLFRGVGLCASFVDHHQDMERFLIGKPGSLFHTDQITYDPGRYGWRRDRDFLVSLGQSTLEFLRPLGGVVLFIETFTPHPLNLLISSRVMNNPMWVVLKTGANRVEIEFDTKPDRDVWCLSLTCETWVPDLVLNNGDRSEIAYHLSAIEEITWPEARTSGTAIPGTWPG